MRLKLSPSSLRASACTSVYFLCGGCICFQQLVSAVCIQRRCFVPFVLSGCIRQSCRSPAVGRFPCGRWQFSLRFQIVAGIVVRAFGIICHVKFLAQVAVVGIRHERAVTGHVGWIPNLSFFFLRCLCGGINGALIWADRTTVTYWSAPIGSRLSLSGHFHWNSSVNKLNSLHSFTVFFPWHLLAGLLRCGQSRCRCLPVAWTVPGVSLFLSVSSYAVLMRANSFSLRLMLFSCSLISGMISRQVPAIHRWFRRWADCRIR